MPSRDLHGDLGGGIWAVIASSMDAARIADPVALGEHRDHFGPVRIVAIGTVSGRVPLVRTQRPACGLLGLGLCRTLAAQSPKLIE